MDASLLPRIDIQLLIKNMGGSDRILPKLFELFVESCTTSIHRMEVALSDNDIKAWVAAAHELKGAALNVTARRIATLCHEAEHVAELKKKEGAALLYHLNKEAALVRQEIAALGW